MYLAGLPASVAGRMAPQVHDLPGLDDRLAGLFKGVWVVVGCRGWLVTIGCVASARVPRGRGAWPDGSTRACLTAGSPQGATDG